MIIALGLVILAAAVVISVAGVLNNRGASHSLGHSFTVLGHHMNTSSGAVFLYGICLGAIGLAGLLLLMSGVRRSGRRSKKNRRELEEARLAVAAIARERDHSGQTNAEAPARLGSNHPFFDPMPAPPAASAQPVAPAPPAPPDSAATHRTP